MRSRACSRRRPSSPSLSSPCRRRLQREGHARRHLRRAADVRQPHQGVPAHADAAHAGVRVNLYWGSAPAERAGSGSPSGGRRTPPIPTTRPTTGRSTTARSVSLSGTGSRCCSRSTARPAGRTAAGHQRPADADDGPPQLRLRGGKAVQRHLTPARHRSAYAAPLPAVRMWLAWNEPNNPVFLRRSTGSGTGAGSIQSAVDYARICTAVYAGRQATLLEARRSVAGSPLRAATTRRGRAGRRCRRWRSSARPSAPG